MSKDAGKRFIEATLYKNMSKSDQAEGKKQPPLEMPYDGDPIDLPDPFMVQLDDISVKSAIEQRKSHRSYKDTPLSTAELSYLLWATQGVREKKDKATLRTVPSAGARHAFETYLLINNVETLEPGLYRYLALEHKLLPLSAPSDIALKLRDGCLGQKMIETGAVSFFWVADTYRMTYRSGERGYRYIFLDAGHVCAHLYLAAQEIGAGTVAVAAYDDETVNALLGLDGDRQFTAYIAPLGKV